MHTRKHYRLTIWITCLVLALAACQGIPAASTPTRVGAGLPTPLPSATAAPQPSATPRPNQGVFVTPENADAGLVERIKKLLTELSVRDELQLQVQTSLEASLPAAKRTMPPAIGPVWLPFSSSPAYLLKYSMARESAE